MTRKLTPADMQRMFVEEREAFDGALLDDKLPADAVRKAYSCLFKGHPEYTGVLVPRMKKHELLSDIRGYLARNN